MDRRTFLAAMAAGAIVTAEGLWIPGQKLISIPRLKPRFEWVTYGENQVWTRSKMTAKQHQSFVELMERYQASMKAQLDAMTFPRPAF